MNPTDASRPSRPAHGDLDLVPRSVRGGARPPGRGRPAPTSSRPPRHPEYLAVLRELVRVDLEFAWERGDRAAAGVLPRPVPRTVRRPGERPGGRLGGVPAAAGGRGGADRGRVPRPVRGRAVRPDRPARQRPRAADRAVRRRPLPGRLRLPAAPPCRYRSRGTRCAGSWSSPNWAAGRSAGCSWPGSRTWPTGWWRSRCRPGCRASRRPWPGSSTPTSSRSTRSTGTGRTTPSACRTSGRPPWPTCSTPSATGGAGLGPGRTWPARSPTGPGRRWRTRPPPRRRRDRRRGRAGRRRPADALDALARLGYVEAVLWLGAQAGRRAGPRPRARHPPPGPEAGQRPAHGRGPADAPRLQPRRRRRRPGHGRAGVGGTLRYMAPEQLAAAGRPAGHADARGGRLRPGAGAVRAAHRRVPVPGPDRPAVGRCCRACGPTGCGRRPTAARLRPDAPPAVAAILAKCLAPDPADRYPSAAELREDLHRQLDEPAAAATPRSRRPASGPASGRGGTRGWRPGRPCRRSPRSLLLIASAGGWWWYREAARLEGQRLAAAVGNELELVRPLASHGRVTAATPTAQLREARDRCRAALEPLGVTAGDHWKDGKFIRRLSGGGRDQLCRRRGAGAAPVGGGGGGLRERSADPAERAELLAEALTVSDRAEGGVRRLLPRRGDRPAQPPPRTGRAGAGRHGPAARGPCPASTLRTAEYVSAVAELRTGRRFGRGGEAEPARPLRPTQRVRVERRWGRPGCGSASGTTRSCGPRRGGPGPRLPVGVLPPRGRVPGGRPVRRRRKRLHPCAGAGPKCPSAAEPGDRAGPPK